MHQPNPNKIFPLCIIMAKICAKNHKVFHFVILACEKISDLQSLLSQVEKSQLPGVCEKAFILARICCWNLNL